MKKTIIGVIIGILLSISSVAIAKDNVIRTWYKTDSLNLEIGTYIYKTYDENTNIVCYAVMGGNGAVAISCLKNN